MEFTTLTPSNNESYQNISEISTHRLLKPEEYYACAVFLFLFSFLGILENALLVKVLWERTMFHEHIFVAIKALCGAQFVISLVCLPMGALSSLHKSWLFKKGGCVFFGFLHQAILLSISFALCGLMTVCSLVVCTPNIKQYITEKRTLLVLGVSLAICLIFAAFPIGGIRTYNPEGYGFLCALNWSDESQEISYLVATLLFTFFLPLLVLFTTMTATLYSVHRCNRTNTIEDIFEMAVAKEDQKHSRTVSIITGVFLMTTTPYVVINLRRMTGAAVPDALVTATAILAQSFVTLKPVFIVLSLDKIRKALFKLVMPIEQMSRPVSVQGTIAVRSGSRVQLRSRMGIYTRHNSVIPRSRMASDASMIGSLHNNAGVSYMLDDTRGAAASSSADREPSVVSDVQDHTGAASAEEVFHDSAIGGLVASRRKTFTNIKQTKTFSHQESELDLTLPQVEEVSVSTLQDERTSSDKF